jgi:hypothetical protein
MKLMEEKIASRDVNRFLPTRLIFILAVLIGLYPVDRVARGEIFFQTKQLRMLLDERGHVVELLDRNNGTNYVAAAHTAPLLTAYLADGRRTPESVNWQADSNRLTFGYGQSKVVIGISEHPTHLGFEVLEATPEGTIERIQWGPVATTLSNHISEVVGVVRNSDFAIGLLGLNVKTLGGWADDSEGRDTSRGRAAAGNDWGSTLQAYSFDRSMPRRVDAWGGHFPNMPVPPIEGETLVGSRIAVFGGPAEQALQQIGEIALSEGLPRPIYQGVWSRLNPELGRSYLIAEFSESNIDTMIGYAQKGNFLSLYHPNPFSSWGHYQPSQRYFPSGESGLKNCVDRATQAGLLLGVHTLTNFIQTGDAYVTPSPDTRLAKTGSSRLVGQVSADATTLEVESPEYFDNQQANWLRTVMVNGELIRYGRVSQSPPWQLVDCQRGAFGSRAAEHAEGSEVAKLMDHPYRVFLADHELQREIAIRLADLFNRTGLNHLDFDGHEGCWASGQGDYGIEMFAQVFYDHVNHFVHNGTSNSQPFYWHINTCCNWGEPWYGGFRSSMAEYRINNQALLERNWMPKMLGWFQFTSETSLADIEWLMARSAGYDSGFALVASEKVFGQNPLTDELLERIRVWESLRMAGAFSAEQKEAMRDSEREFHLTLTDQGPTLRAYRITEAFQHTPQQLQPGEPTASQWQYTQIGERQPLQLLLEVIGEQGQVQDISLELNSYLTFTIPVPLKAGQTLVCDGTSTLRVFGPDGRQVSKHTLDQLPPELAAGLHSVVVDATFEEGSDVSLSCRFKSLGPGQLVGSTIAP